MAFEDSEIVPEYVERFTNYLRKKKEIYILGNVWWSYVARRFTYTIKIKNIYFHKARNSRPPPNSSDLQHIITCSGERILVWAPWFLRAGALWAPAKTNRVSSPAFKYSLYSQYICGACIVHRIASLTIPTSYDPASHFSFNVHLVFLFWNKAFSQLFLVYVKDPSLDDWE